jgi:hypothetical protein
MYLDDIGCKDVDWIELARDRIQWRAFVNKMMELRFH